MIRVEGNTMAIEGAVTLDNICQLRETAKSNIGQADWTVDWSGVKEVDSTALSLILAWQRESADHGKQIHNVNLPANLQSLAELYGVVELIPVG